TWRRRKYIERYRGTDLVVLSDTLVNSYLSSEGRLRTRRRLAIYLYTSTSPWRRRSHTVHKWRERPIRATCSPELVPDTISTVASSTTDPNSTSCTIVEHRLPSILCTNGNYNGTYVMFPSLTSTFHLLSKMI